MTHIGYKFGAVPPDAGPAPPTLSCVALFARLLRFGAIAFGGAVAQIAIIRRELVDGGRILFGNPFSQIMNS
jgi:chromate transporter